MMRERAADHARANKCYLVACHESASFAIKSDKA
jgi:hypothetical protein